LGSIHQKSVIGVKEKALFGVVLRIMGKTWQKHAKLHISYKTVLKIKKPPINFQQSLF